jgi:hypothetical protein
LRQQFAIDLLDQADAEPADEAVEEGGDESVGEGESDAGGAPEDEADAASDEGELGGAAFAKPNDETARVAGDGESPCDATGGPHLETWGKSFENHSANLELSLGKHQYAPDAKKKTWTASQRVRKKMCASTIPRHRAAISLNTLPSAVKINKAAANTPVHSRRRGSGVAGGSKNCGTDCGTGGCGLNATAPPHRLRLDKHHPNSKPQSWKSSLSGFASHNGTGRKSCVQTPIDRLVSCATRPKAPPKAG